MGIAATKSVHSATGSAVARRRKPRRPSPEACVKTALIGRAILKIAESRHPERVAIRALLKANELLGLVVGVRLSRSFRITSPRDLCPVSPESIRFQRATVSALTMTKRLAHPNYNVTSDGQTFVMVAAADTEADRVHVVVHWIEELKSLVFSVED